MARNVTNEIRKYIAAGWAVVPVPAGKKSPQLKSWQKLRLNISDLPEYFSAGENVGVLLGEASNGLVDVDLDSQEAIFLASAFLPETERVHGRKSKMSSHYWYRADSVPKPQKFCDIDGSSLLEVRSTGQQTIVPPSVHPSGERVRWELDGKPAHVESALLVASVGRLAAATLFARHWSAEGQRHEATLALSGMLLRAGWHRRLTPILWSRRLMTRSRPS